MGQITEGLASIPSTETRAELEPWQKVSVARNQLLGAHAIFKAVFTRAAIVMDPKLDAFMEELLASADDLKPLIEQLKTPKKRKPKVELPNFTVDPNKKPWI